MIKALHTRADTLTALETLVAGAQTEVILAFRVFSPDTPLLSPELRERGLATWLDLVAWITRRGVHLTVLIADEDPIFASDRHRRAWLAASGLANVAQGDAQILCAPHGQSAGLLRRWLLRGPSRRKLATLREDDPRRLTHPQRAALANGPTLRPLALNQSFAIADGQRALIGGFTSDSRRDARDWHDVSALVTDADFAGALRAHFSDTWRDAIATGAPPLDTPPRPFTGLSRRQSRPELRLLRTLTAPTHRPLTLTAAPRATDAATRLPALVRGAKRSIYLETTAIRDEGVTEALCAAARVAPDLALVVILHPGADRLSFAGALPGTVEQARALQDERLLRLHRAYGKRLTLLRHASATPSTGTDPLPGRLLVVDGTSTVIGSHNMTTRSLWQDTEASVLIRDASFAASVLEQRLAHWFDTPPNTHATDPATWADLPPTLHRVTPDAPGRRLAWSERLPELLF